MCLAHPTGVASRIGEQGNSQQNQHDDDELTATRESNSVHAMSFRSALIRTCTIIVRGVEAGEGKDTYLNYQSIPEAVS